MHRVYLINNIALGDKSVIQSRVNRFPDILTVDTHDMYLVNSILSVVLSGDNLYIIGKIYLEEASYSRYIKMLLYYLPNITLVLPTEQYTNTALVYKLKIDGFSIIENTDMNKPIPTSDNTIIYDCILREHNIDNSNTDTQDIVLVGYPSKVYKRYYMKDSINNWRT